MSAHGQDPRRREMPQHQGYVPAVRELCGIVDGIGRVELHVGGPRLCRARLAGVPPQELVGRKLASLVVVIDPPGTPVAGRDHKPRRLSASVEPSGQTLEQAAAALARRLRALASAGAL